MPRYLLEGYAASTELALTEARTRAREAAELGAGVRYVRTTFVRPRREERAMEGQGVRSTPSASTSSLPRSRNFTRIESDTAAARYHHVTLAFPGPTTLTWSAARGVWCWFQSCRRPRSESCCSSLEDGAGGRSQRLSDSTCEPSTGTSRKRTGSSRRHRQSSIEFEQESD